jgi:hypothetical protein
VFLVNIGDIEEPQSPNQDVSSGSGITDGEIGETMVPIGDGFRNTESLGNIREGIPLLSCPDRPNDWVNMFKSC